jgi:hypothetical protein
MNATEISKYEKRSTEKPIGWNQDHKPKRKKPSHPESDLQKACVKWFKYQYPQRVIFAIPNGGKRSRVEAAIMQGEGVMSGVADLFIPEPKSKIVSEFKIITHGLWIEMKYGKGKLTESQESFGLEMKARGYEYIVCYTLDEFMKAVNHYFN